MALLDTPRRLLLDNISEENREDFRKFSEIYNYFIEQVTNTVNGQLDYQNLTKVLVTVDVTVDTNGNPILGGSFSAPQGMVGHKVLRADNLTNPNTFPTSAPFMTFTASNSGNGIYNIKNVTGLPANNKFRLLVELIPN